MLVLVTTEPDSPLALQRMTAGYRMALSDTASARIVLAQSRPEVCDEYLTFVRQSSDTAPQAGAFEDGVMRARNDGFALHQVHGSREKSLAVAIRTDGIAVAGLTARFIASALTDSKAQSDVLPVLQTIASRISDALASAATTS